MFGVLQTAILRLEVTASAQVIQAHLTQLELIRQWAWPQQYPTELGRLAVGVEFSSFLGPLEIGHRVTVCEASALEFVLWGGIDGFSRWRWGDGWLEQTMIGVSLIPLELGQHKLLSQLQMSLTTKVNRFLP